MFQKKKCISNIEAGISAGYVRDNTKRYLVVICLISAIYKKHFPNN